MVDAHYVGRYRGVQAHWRSVRSAIPFQYSGVVIGCLTKDGQVDMEKNRRMMEAARPLRFLFFSIVM